MKFVEFLILSNLYIVNINAHSQPSCIKKLDKTTCVGFPRYYDFNHLSNQLPSSDSNNTFYASRDRIYQIQPGIDKICPELPISEYTEKFPMATAKAGENITLQHPPRGHSSQPSSNVWIYMYPKPDMYPTNKQLNSSEFKLIGEYPFDNCESVSKEVSWANCTGTIIIPQNLTSGVYTFWWRWNLNEIPYSDCFEINISNNGTTNDTTNGTTNGTTNVLTDDSSNSKLQKFKENKYKKINKTLKKELKEPESHLHIHKHN